MKAASGSGEQEHEGIGELLFRLDDEALLILRAHLLTERYLWKFLDRELATQFLSKEVNLRYHQLVALSKIVAQNETLDWFWDFLSNLNRVRNVLAHEIVDSEKMDSLIASVFQKATPHIDLDPFARRPRVERLRWLFMILCGVADSLPERVEKERSAKKE